MYAIVEIAGQQYKVEKGQQIYVHRLEQKEGSDVEFTDVLLIENDGKVSVGKPTLEGAKISAKVLEHMKGDKVLVFKKKRRKGYQKLNGHRQLFSKLEIGDILEKGAKVEKKESKAAEKPKAEKPKTEAKKSSSGEKAQPKAAKAEEKKETKAPASKSTASKSVKKEETGKGKKTEPKAKSAARPAEKKEEKPKAEKKAADKGDEKSES